MNKLFIRNEKEKDHRAVEEAVREAFWNLYIPGCDEHYLVNLIRKSPDFIPELAFVAELDNQIVGSIFFTKSYVLDKEGVRHETITFGPVSVLPEFHNQGIGASLIEHSKKEAIKYGYKAIIIYGYPDYYKRLGFIHAKEYGITNREGKYPFAHLVLELTQGALDNISGEAYESDIYNVDENDAHNYDKLFEPKIKEVAPSQETFAKTLSLYL